MVLLTSELNGKGFHSSSLVCDVLYSFNSPLVTIVHGFYESYSGCELHPPVVFLSLKPLLIETVHILHSGQQTRWVGLDQYKDQHRHEVISGWNGLLIGQTQQVHDGGGTA